MPYPLCVTQVKMAYFNRCFKILLLLGLFRPSHSVAGWFEDNGNAAFPSLANVIVQNAADISVCREVCEGLDVIACSGYEFDGTKCELRDDLNASTTILPNDPASGTVAVYGFREDPNLPGDPASRCSAPECEFTDTGNGFYSCTGSTEELCTQCYKKEQADISFILEYLQISDGLSEAECAAKCEANYDCAAFVVMGACFLFPSASLTVSASGSFQVNLKGAPVDGGWSVDGTLGECSATCGGGTQTLTRTCTNPVPQCGADCSGDATITQECNTQQCPPDPVALGTNRATATCPDKSWWQEGDHCYLFVVKPKLRWQEALQACAEMGEGSRLITFDDSAELVRVTDHINQENDLRKVPCFWTAGKKVNGEWVWMTYEHDDGNEMKFYDWGTNEPNNLKKKEACVNLSKKRDFLYNDSSCRKKSAFICKK